VVTAVYTGSVIDGPGSGCERGWMRVDEWVDGWIEGRTIDVD